MKELVMIYKVFLLFFDFSLVNGRGKKELKIATFFNFCGLLKPNGFQLEATLTEGQSVTSQREINL
ncbi:hypothetical protein [Emticicia aquatilis]|uniref:hypothetical protein n=1 Tax=Emticicia aquatilis TaxID=1537369 RepID=UPI00166883A3|nr:hypothetical protein [Emticicia aquatilis]